MRLQLVACKTFAYYWNCLEVIVPVYVSLEKGNKADSHKACNIQFFIRQQTKLLSKPVRFEWNTIIETDSETIKSNVLPASC